jgi:transcriptional regulator with XRE-family HTH domain
MELHNLSNRSLAAAAGISEGAVRNLLRYGQEEGVKDPDPRTLRAVANALKVKPATLFQLAGYLPREREVNSWRAVFVADVFDRLPPVKQDIVMAVLQAIAEAPEEKTQIDEMRRREQKKVARQSAPTILREAANQLIVYYAMTSPRDVEKIEEDVEILGKQWQELSPQAQLQIAALIENKLSMEFDPKMVISDW